MSDYISKSALLKLFVNLQDEHETNAISYQALYEVILNQPTIDEKEIICKAFERVVERLEEYEYSHLIEKDSNIAKHCESHGDCEGVDCLLCVMDKAIEIVKEECGINE